MAATASLQTQGRGSGGGTDGPSDNDKRKRKLDSCFDSDDDEADDYSFDDDKGASGEPHDKDRLARESHCEIERRRRTKMATYVNELCDMVPSCSTLARKPDKLTILRLAVAHMKAIQGPGHSHVADKSYKPSFLTDQELKHLVLEATDGFLFVVRCDTGCVIYVSDSVTPVLCQSQNDWFGNSLYDLIHPDDLEKLREQLSSESHNSSRILDLKTGTVKKEGQQTNMRLCLGSRRAFIIRMRLGNMSVNPMTASHTVRVRQRNTLGPSNDGQQYAVVHVTGYVRNWPPTSHDAISCSPLGGSVPVERGDGDDLSHCCLVAIGRLQVTSTSNCSDLVGSTSSTEFISRHSLDGKITFVDQRVTGLLGYQPQDLLGKSVYEFYHPEDQAQMKETFEQVIKMKGQVISVMYRFSSKSREWIWLRTSALSFLNPYTEDVEYIVCTNSSTKQSTGSLSCAESGRSVSDATVPTIGYSPLMGGDSVVGGGVADVSVSSRYAAAADLYSHVMSQQVVCTGPQQDSYDYNGPSIIKYQNSAYSNVGSGLNTLHTMNQGSSSVNHTQSPTPATASWNHTSYRQSTVDDFSNNETSIPYNTATRSDSTESSSASGYALIGGQRASSSQSAYLPPTVAWPSPWQGSAADSSSTDAVAMLEGRARHQSVITGAPRVDGNLAPRVDGNLAPRLDGNLAQHHHQQQEEFSDVLRMLDSHGGSDFTDLPAMFNGFTD